MSSRPTTRQRVRQVLAPVPGAVPAARLVAETVLVTGRHRATALAAEAAFFLLLSLPSLLLAVVAGAGFASGWFGPSLVLRTAEAIRSWSLRFLSPDTVEELIMPTVVETLTAGRADIVSAGFLVSLWSGSRALRVFLDTIAIMYGQGGRRGAVRTRLLSLTAYLVSLVGMGVTLPMVLIGPGYLRRWLPDRLDVLVGGYWPVVAVLGVASLTALFHVATPERSPYLRDLPGALLAVVVWVLSSVALRVWADQASGGTTVFGPLSAPIILLVWLYFTALAVLVGAALNSALRRLWPPPEYRGPRARVHEWWEERRTG